MFFLRSLMEGLLLIFGWVPATLLMMFVAFGFYSVFGNLLVVNWQINLILFAVCTGGITGYVGLTSLCWPIYKLSRKTLIVCLTVGLVTLSYVIIAGIISDQSLLMISNDWVDWYLFVSPVFITSIQLIILLAGQFKVKESR